MTERGTDIPGVSGVSWFGAAPEKAKLGVLLLHGRTQNPEIMRELLVERLAVPAVCYLAPRAEGDSWYPAGFLAPSADNEPRLSQSLAALERCTALLAERGFLPATQVVLGFSQGACLGSEFVWRAQRRFGALLALTGGLIGPPDKRTWARMQEGTEAWTDMPVLLGGSSDDPWVPAFRMRETAEVFTAHGARVQLKFYESNTHEVPDDQVALVRDVLVKLRDG